MIDELDLDQKPWPHSVEAEQSILMSLLVDSDAISQVIDSLAIEDFYSTAHQVIYAACIQLFKMGHPVCHISVSETLKLSGNYEKAGGFTYLAELIASHWTNEGFSYFVELVKDQSLSRQLIQFGWQTVSIAFSTEGKNALDECQKRLISLNPDTKKEDKTLEQILSESLDHMEACMNGSPPGVPTGFIELDGITGGMTPSNLIILAARPGMGKTSFALNIAADVAIRQQKKVLFLSLEMSENELGIRLLTAESGESATISRKRQKFVEIAKSPLVILDRPSLMVPQLRSAIMVQSILAPAVSLVVIDYLQLMRGNGENRNQEISTLTRELKSLAREFNVPILCLSQLSRGVEARQNKTPMLSDLRDSGSIEQDADVVLFIYRESYYNSSASNNGLTKIIVAKNRMGPNGEISLGFRKNITKFINI